jgi:hypothetical protein
MSEGLPLGYQSITSTNLKKYGLFEQLNSWLKTVIEMCFRFQQEV